MKKCPKCGEIKALVDFHHHRKEGLQGYCKICNNEYGRKYSLENREKIQKRDKIHKQKVRALREITVRIKKELPLQENGKEITVDLNYRFLRIAHYELTVKDLINLGFFEIV